MDWQQYAGQKINGEGFLLELQHYLNCCNDVGLADIQTSLNQMIVLDYLIGNEDPHQNNFGVIRNTDTLKFLGAAPIFDSGTSLWFDKPTSMVGERQITCKPFKSKHDEQLRLVSSFNWIDFSQLNDLEDAWMELTADLLFLDEPRRTAIAKAFRQRVDELKVSATKKNWYTPDNLLFEVTKDKKYSG